MNKHNIQSILNIFVFIAISLASSCGPVTAIPSPTLTLISSQVPTVTAASIPTYTAVPIQLEGTIFYSDFNAIYSIDLKSQKSKIIFQQSGKLTYLTVNNYLYTTLFSQKSNKIEIFKSNLDGTRRQQLTVDGAVQIFSVDPSNHYLIYNNRQAILKILNLDNNTTTVIAKPNKDVKGFEWIFASSWSPDGKKLIYRRVLNPAADDICSLFIYDILKKKSTELLPNEKVGCPTTWSPDGKNIALVSNNNKSGTVFILNLEDNSYRQISIPSTGYVYFNNLAWSADGSSLIVGAGTTIYLLDIKSNYLETISTYPDLTNWFGLSPDRSMVLYEQSNRTVNNNLFLFDIDKRTTVKISTQNSIPTGVDILSWNYSSVWSPDGRFFAYFTPSDSMDFHTNPTLILNIQNVKTGGITAFEVPTIHGSEFYKSPYWVYSNK